ncbi:MAG: AAA family ATPase [Dietzia sp.]
MTAARRVLVVGSSGSGKTTTAKRIADTCGIPHIELDALHWGPDWTAATSDEMRERVLRAIEGGSWVVDGNYRSKIGTLVWDRADTIVWINPSRLVAVSRAFRRTVRRVATRQELWNGNRERWSSLMFWRGEESLLWLAWALYPRTRDRYEAAMKEPANAHRRMYRVRGARDLHRVLAALGSTSATLDPPGPTGTS